MIIKCAMSQNVPYRDRNGTTKICTLRPGEHNYPMLRPAEDPLLAETLFSLRKIKRISFNDLLPRDKEILKDCPEGVSPADYLAEKVLSKPSPVGRMVNKKSNGRRRAEVKKAEEKQSARGNKKPKTPASAHAKNAGNGGEPGGISDKK